MRNDGFKVKTDRNILAKRYGRPADYEDINNKMRKMLESGDSGESGFDDPSVPEVRIRHTNEERLAYYRSHGLSRCDDYPGGDTAFKHDVLSGEFHHDDVTREGLLREDAYVMDRMRDGRFKFDVSFREYFGNPLMLLAYLDNAGRNGFGVHFDYPAGLPAFYRDVLSGKYANDFLRWFEK